MQARTQKNDSFGFGYVPCHPRVTGLAPNHHEIIHYDGLVSMCPHLAREVAHSEKLALSPPLVRSIISGQMGYFYRNDSVDIALTTSEIFRLLRRQLFIEEFLILSKKVGIFFDISHHFYDESTGFALHRFSTPQQQFAREQLL